MACISISMAINHNHCAFCNQNGAVFNEPFFYSVKVNQDVKLTKNVLRTKLFGTIQEQYFTATVKYITVG